MRTALRLVDEHGLLALTMRALATERQVSPMALYNHVRDKDEPGLAQVYDTQVRIGLHGLLIMKRLLGLLLQARFSPPEAADAFFVLLPTPPASTRWAASTPTTPRCHPSRSSIAAVTAHLREVHRGRFEYGLDTLLTGLRTAHTPPQQCRIGERASG